jgi:hypothetical protein
LVKINEMKSSSLLCSRRRTRADGNSDDDATRRTSANLAHHARASSLSLSRCRVRFPLPFFFIAQQGAEPPEPRRRPPLRPSSPPPLDSPCPKPRDLAPKILRPSTNSFAPIPGRIEAPEPRPPLPSRRASPSSSTSHLRPYSAQIEGPMSFLVLSSSSSFFFPLPFRYHPRRSAAAPPCAPCRHRAHAAGPPCASLCSVAARPKAASSP